MRLLILLLKAVSYLALALVSAGIGALVFVAETGLCPRLDEGAVDCVSPFAERLGNFGLGVVLAIVFTGLPGLLAVAGLVFLIRCPALETRAVAMADEARREVDAVGHETPSRPLPRAVW
ncbi:MAG: hypothetical protein ACHQAY_21895 [Hyphomicrobiales bacterium]